jgi:putative DNA primase/helicase
MSDRISAIAKQASSNPANLITKDQFDAHDHLLNCRNGIVDLYTGELLPHDRTLFLSQLCPSDYIPTATAPNWDNVLNAVTRNHPELIPFLRDSQDTSPKGTREGSFWHCATVRAEQGKALFGTRFRELLAVISYEV